MPIAKFISGTSVPIYKFVFFSAVQNLSIMIIYKCAQSNGVAVDVA